MSKQLVCQYLENISRRALGEHQHIIKEYIRRRHGVYALYRKDKLYYIGLATNFLTRLKQHLKDRHANTWDRFSVYLTINDEHLKELESLVLRIAFPTGNIQKGKFAKADDLQRKFRKQIIEYQRVELDNIFATKNRHEAFKKRIAEEGKDPMLAPYTKKPLNIIFKYKNKIFSAKVKSDGSIRFRGNIYNSPSLAAVAAVKKPRNGWFSWKYQRSPGEWVFIDELRR